MVALLLLSGALWLTSLHAARATRVKPSQLTWILFVGLALRIATSFSPPAYEDDFYRYLWDGAVTAHALNPYAEAPETVDEAARHADVYTALREDAGTVHERINHPWLKTIYPPVTQAAFAIAHWMAPWSLTSWRLVLGVADLVALGLLAVLLRRLGLPLAWIVTYWWNPLLVKEIYNSCHMDVLTLPFLLGSVLLFMRDRHVLAVAMLALSTGTKLWPVMLLPLFLRPLLNRPRTLAASLILFGVIVAACALPVAMGGLTDDSGFVRYAARWEMNDGLYMLVLWCAQLLPGDLAAHTVARGVIFGLLSVLALALAWRPVQSGGSLCGRALFIVAAIFLFSPTQFPWYYTWLIVFLVPRPRFSLLLMGALLPIYYLRFAFAEAELIPIFDYGVVWMQYVPVYLLLIREAILAKAAGQEQVATTPGGSWHSEEATTSTGEPL